MKNRVTFAALAPLLLLTACGSEEFDASETLAEADQAIIIHKSGVEGVTITDNLLVDFTKFDYDPLGAVDNATVSACIEQNGTTNCASRTENFGSSTAHFPSGTHRFYFQIERKDGVCFKLNFKAKKNNAVKKSTAPSTTYCWDATNYDWRRQGSAGGIGPEDSISGRDGNWGVKWYWRVSWEATTMTGTVAPRTSAQPEGKDWHHLPPIKSTWHNPEDYIFGELSANSGNPDLYAAVTYQPTLTNYACRPMNPGKDPQFPEAADETCYLTATGNAGMYFSINNPRTDANADYRLVVKRPTTGNWTAWFDRDDATSGNGDGEHLASFIAEGYPVCAQPLAIQCRRISDNVDYFKTGEIVTCLPSKGAYCLNSWQSDGRCDDYAVRFLCP